MVTVGVVNIGSAVNSGISGTIGCGHHAALPHRRPPSKWPLDSTIEPICLPFVNACRAWSMPGRQRCLDVVTGRRTRWADSVATLALPGEMVGSAAMA